MSSTVPINYEFREPPSSDGGLTIELLVDGVLYARAEVSAEVLSDLRTQLGLDRSSVTEQLRKALHDSLVLPGRFVEISDLKESTPLRFTARYTYRARDQVSTGLVWYDVRSSLTGPETVSALVRNKMRTEVHQTLTSAGSTARELVNDPTSRR